jgi:ribonucleoside-diphosphate reductase alpha chain
MLVQKRDGSTEPFKPAKARSWVQWVIRNLRKSVEMENYILSTTLDRLTGEMVKTTDIHETMINVCLDKEEEAYSAIAAELRKATLYKNLSHAGMLQPEKATFQDLIDFFALNGLWDVTWASGWTKEQVALVEETYIELESTALEYWSVSQWADKYSKTVAGEPVETPAMGCLAIALAFHGPTDLGFEYARDLVLCKTNLPTPVLNGVRDGNWDTISCCVIHAEDTTASIDAAEYLASSMTAKKAGIGIFIDARSKNDPVKGGQVDHLGKAPIFASIEKAVKKYTQITRGGSATTTIKALDPDILNMLLWKTQRIDAQQRIDKIDYSFAYNDAFVDALLHNEDWYLFSKQAAPFVHDGFHLDSVAYNSLVRKALMLKLPHKKVKALEVFIEFAKSRWETGRIYCINLSRVNEHTPFLDLIYQSNLCMEIALPTKAWESMEDLVIEKDDHVGEVAFCALSALNVTNIGLEEYFAVAERALRTVDRMIELAPGLHPNLGKDIRKRRSVGIGITGLAGFLYKNGFDYDGSEESLVATEQLAAVHYYALLQASQKMSAETGFEVEGIDNEWLPIDTSNFVSDPDLWDLELDWEALRGKPRMHSVLVAHMPTESSAVFSGATNGLYPSRDRVIYKKARTGRVQFISKYYDPAKNMNYYEIDMIPYYKAVQNYSDQAISADYPTDYTKYPNMKVPITVIIEWFIRQAKAGIKTSYYQVFKDTKSVEVDCSSCKL